ncbi:MAG TPA: Hpt domain-containing protein [Burkholderiales bacterium]|nr:Hpt domain-containing protein [Burkholderiales bacterium]
METVRHRVLVSGELRDLIPRFLDNRRLELGQLGDAIARSDLEAARCIGHGLKGVGGGYGFDEITRLGAAIEHCARAGGAGLEELVRELAEYLESVDIIYTTD